MDLYTFESGSGKHLLRVTDEVPKRVSALDIVSAVCGPHNCSKKWSDFRASAPHVVEGMFKFRGKGQRPTPVVTAGGIDALIRGLPAGAALCEDHADGVAELCRFIDPPLGPMQLFGLTGDFGSERVRVTDHIPRQVSVLDVIQAVTKNEQPRKTWFDMKSQHPEVVTQTTEFKFPGRGQRLTPVTGVNGLVTIVNLLPGQRAASFRAAGADVLVRYLGGDASLVAEIQANRQRQEIAAPSAPERIFGEAVEAKQRFRSQTGILDYAAPQVYIGLPDGTFSDLHHVGNPPAEDVDLAAVSILKTGFQLSKGRIQGHGPRYGGFQLLESCVTDACSKLEQEWKDTLKGLGRLLRGKHCNRGGKEDIELVWVRDLDDYERNILPHWHELLNKAAVEARCAETLQLKVEQERTKQTRIDTESAERARIAEARASERARVAEAEASERVRTAQVEAAERALVADEMTKRLEAAERTKQAVERARECEALELTKRMEAKERTAQAIERTRQLQLELELELAQLGRKRSRPESERQPEPEVQLQTQGSPEMPSEVDFVIASDDAKSKRVGRYALDGAFLDHWASASAAAVALHLSFGNIRSCVRGSREQVGGYVWKSEPEDIVRTVPYREDGIYKQLRPDGSLVTSYLTQADAARAIGVELLRFRDAVTNNKQLKGYTWTSLDALARAKPRTRRQSALEGPSGT